MKKTHILIILASVLIGCNQNPSTSNKSEFANKIESVDDTMPNVNIDSNKSLTDSVIPLNKDKIKNDNSGSVETNNPYKSDVAKVFKLKQKISDNFKKCKQTNRDFVMGICYGIPNLRFEYEDFHNYTGYQISALTESMHYDEKLFNAVILRIYLTNCKNYYDDEVGYESFKIVLQKNFLLTEDEFMDIHALAVRLYEEWMTNQYQNTQRVNEN